MAAKGLGFDAEGRALDVPIRRWETLVELPGGRLASETGIRELVSRGELSSSTAASVGVGGNGGGAAGVGGGRGADDLAVEFDRLVEIDPDDFFRAKGA